ncbi:MAG: SurA N-terminal domain-containing protein [Alphaproteobacteria bacterium]|nr:SurA N-terminal domain-containing protein [Alphaproteobacteria bacterium]
MLKQMRDSTNRPLAKVLMGVLIFSFVGWGAANWILGESRFDDSIVKIGREPITLAQFERERSRQLSQMTPELRRQVFADQQATIQLGQQILSSLGSQLMLDQRAEDIGLAASPAAVAAVIRAEPAFQENGRFSAIMFDVTLANMGLSEATFAEHIRREIMRDMLLSPLAAGVLVPEFVVTAMHGARGAQRRIEFARVSFDDFAETGNPTEEQLRQTHTRNPKIIPEFRSVSIVIVPADMSQPDSVDAAFVSAQRLEDAIIGGEAMRDAASKVPGARFAHVAAVNADWTDKNGRAVTDAAFGDEARRIAFALEAGIESEVIETRSGFIIVRVEKIEPAHAAPFDSMRAELVALWRTEQRRVRAYERANQILIDANRENTPVGRPVTVTRTSGAPLEILAAAFRTPVGTNTIVPGANAFFVLSVKDAVVPNMNEARRTELQADAGRALARIMQDDYTAFLGRKYPVKINARMFRRLFGE